MSVSTLAESRFVYNRVSGNTGKTASPITNNTTRTGSNIQARAQSPELSVRPRPRPVVVTCHPDSMEVLVQADMFDTGLQVEGSHLHLGSGSVAGEENACRALRSGEAEFTIWAHLMECGTKLSVSICMFILAARALKKLVTKHHENLAISSPSQQRRR